MSSGLANEIGLPLRVLRLRHVYGPGEAPHRLLPSLLTGLAANQRIALPGGFQVRDFVYAGDVVKALLAAADQMQSRAGLPATFWNVAKQGGRTVREFSQMTARLSGRGEHLLGFGDMFIRPDENEWLVGSFALIQSQTVWAARHNLESGIAVSLAQITNGATQLRVVP